MIFESDIEHTEPLAEQWEHTRLLENQALGRTARNAGIFAVNAIVTMLEIAAARPLDPSLKSVENAALWIDAGIALISGTRCIYQTATALAYHKKQLNLFAEMMENRLHLHKKAMAEFFLSQTQ